KVGNMVLIEGGSGFGAVGLAYGLPLLFMVVLAGLGYIVVKSDWAVLAGCGVGVVAGFVLARVLGRRKSYVPKAVCVAPPRHSACGRNDGGARA
ncbi:MAG: SoxR reducing system RseC family protein, partial [Clostridia bacterium]|nr:SoxR reducing system RseC family protein [Clostridia bacterium]